MRSWPLAMPLWLAAVPAAAEEGSPGFLGLPPLFWKTANFVAFFGLMVYLLARPLATFFRTRREQIGSQLKEAALHQQEAERLRAEMEQKVAALGGEIAELKERFRREGEREREALERLGDAEAVRLTAQLDDVASRRVAEARRELAVEAAAVAADLALELLKRELKPEDRERLFRAALERLSAQANQEAR